MKLIRINSFQCLLRLVRELELQWYSHPRPRVAL